MSEGGAVAPGTRVLVGARAAVGVGSTGSGEEEQAQATRATADKQMSRRSNFEEEWVRGRVTILERV